MKPGKEEEDSTMFIRRAAATLLVDAEMAIRSGSWIANRARNPFPAMTRLESLLSSVASDDQIGDAVDALYAVMGQARMAGELMDGECAQYELSDILPQLIHAEIPPAPAAANDDGAVRKAA